MTIFASLFTARLIQCAGAFLWQFIDKTFQGSQSLQDRNQGDSGIFYNGQFKPIFLDSFVCFVITINVFMYFFFLKEEFKKHSSIFPAHEHHQHLLCTTCIIRMHKSHLHTPFSYFHSFCTLLLIVRVEEKQPHGSGNVLN